MITWATLSQAREHWSGAPDEDMTLTRLLNAAHEAVNAYAPALAEGAQVPYSYVLAEVMQARAIYRASTSDNGQYGGEDYTVLVYPLDKNIRQLLRPRRVAGPIR